MDTLEYEFDDLPIKVEGGFEAGSLSGKAIVHYYPDGEWFVEEIYLEGSKEIYVSEKIHGLEYKKFNGFETKLIEIVCMTASGIDFTYRLDPFYLHIWSQLTDGRFKDHIQSKVNEALVDEGVRMPTDIGQHSTHHAALSGVSS
jgi:hypothetical protein